jgi:Tfp pilus assembly protein PilN
MSVEVAALDTLQQEYRDAVEAWVAAIRSEEALASANHNETEIDQWEAAEFQQETAGEKAREAKEAYESALREKFFNF